MGRKNKKINIQFLGGSAIDVTGSATLVTYPKENDELGYILLEMGMVQGERTIYSEYEKNANLINKIPCDRLEAVFVCHTHVDHIGNLGALASRDFNGKIIGSKQTMELAKVLLKDCAFIHSKNIETMKNNGKKVEPLFLERDIYSIFDSMEYAPINEIVKLNEYISYRMVNNCHCLGATQLELFIKLPSGQIKKIVYTSDLGSKNNKDLKYFLKNTDIIHKSNLFVCESTYGNASRGFSKKEAKAEREDLKNTIIQYVKNENRVFIPSFSFARTQELMCQLYEWFKDEDWFNEIPIIIDSKLTNDINNCYKKILLDEDKKYWNEVLQWHNFKFVKEYKTTCAILSKRQKGIYISSQGFCEAGHSQLYCQQFLGCSKDAILFVGYCPENSVGGRILNNNTKTVTIQGRTIMKNCFVKQYKTFSSHCQQDELIDYFKQINTDRIVLHHGSLEAKQELKEKAKEELMNCGKTTPITLTEKNMVLSI